MAEVLEHDVYQLIVPSISRDIQGLISVDRMDRFIHVNLIESHPNQVGRQKDLAGIAGSLMAFVADLSFAAGFDGYLSFEAKSELMLHYETAFGARRIGRTNRMVIDNFAAKQLIVRHFGDKHGTDS